MYDTVQVCEGCEEGILYVECWSPRPSSFSSVIFSISKIEEDLLLPLYARFIRANRQVMRKPSIFCSLPFLFWERNQATEQQIIMAKLKNTKNTTTYTLPRLLSTITTETRCQEVKEHPARESQRRQTELQEWDVPFKGENQ